MMQKEYKYLLMDLDGTLYDFDKAEDKALADLIASWGLPACSQKDIDAYHFFNDACWKALEKGEITKDRLKVKRFEDFLAYLKFEHDPMLAGEEYVDFLSQNGFLLDGAEELLQALSQRYELYAVTNGIEKVQQGRWKASGIGRYFKGMFVSDSIGIAKPNLGYFEHVFANIPGFEREKALLIGDSLSSDMKGGVNAQIDTLWYNPKHSVKPDDMPITYEIDDLRKIKDFLCN